MTGDEGEECINSVGKKRSMDFKLPAWKKQKVLTNSFVDDDNHSTGVSEKQFVQVLDKKLLQKGAEGDKPAPLVIPLHHVSATDDLQKRAEKELLREVNGIQTAGSSSLVISSTSTGTVTTTEKKAPLLLANIRPEVQALRDENDRFRADLEFRADDMNVKSHAYESVPVEHFGAALLRGMGWNDNVQQQKPINNRVSAREHRQGLGATGQPPQLNKNRDQLQSPSQQSSDWDKKLQNHLKQQSLLVGSLVWLQDHKYVGKRAVVTAIAGVPGLNKVRVAIEDAKNEELIISKETLILLTDEELAFRPFKYGMFVDVSTNVPSYFGESSSLNLVESRMLLPGDTSNTQTASQNLPVKSPKFTNQEASWLRTGIQVKIISKKVTSANNRSLYLQKGSVVDVPSKNMATVQVQIGDGFFIENVKEKYLETVLPRTGEICLLLTGDNAGETAKLIEKRNDKGQVVIELTDSLEVLVVSMDSIAAFSES